MVRGRLSAYWQRIRDELRIAFAEEHSPHEVAGSFAIGVFITTMPSMGLGVLLFFLFARLSERISKVAIFASVVVINPLVKPPMYVAAFWIGTRLLGGDAIGGEAGVAASAGNVALRTGVGFLLLATTFAAVGYVAMYALTAQYRRRELEFVEELVDDTLLDEPVEE